MKNTYVNGFFRSLCLLLVCAAGCTSPSAKEPKETIPAVPVKVVHPIRTDIITSSSATGTIAPIQESFFGPKVAGRIEVFFVDEGSFVERGSPLMQLEQTRFTLAVQEAQAALAESRANLHNLEQKLKRQEELFQTGVLDRQMLDDMRTQVELARARVGVHAAQLARAEKDFHDTTLYAPFSGFVVERKMNVGETYTPSERSYVFHLVDTSSVEVQVQVFETKKRFLTIGEKISVSVDAVPEQRFEGTVTVVNPLVDTASRKFLVKIQIPNPSFILASGMFARVHIPEEKSLQALTLPTEAIIERDNAQVVFVVEEGAAVERRITTGLRTAEAVEVLSGLQEGESIITEGLYAVKQGTPVTVIQ